MEQSLESYIHSMKDTKTVVNDIINILCQIGIAEKNDAFDSIIYTGPDYLNSRRITYDLIPKIQEETVKTNISQLEEKEEQFFGVMLKDLEESSKKDMRKGGKQNDLKFSITQNKVSSNQIRLEIVEQQQNKEKQLDKERESKQIQNKQDENQVDENYNNESNSELAQNKKNKVNQNVTQEIQKKIKLDVSKVPHSHISYFPVGLQ
ncbi:hypothetical protein PPERSA_03754 [Pseudocohnilembus persalinus]|uniref:Uncharacterized protein n=1 Tax=Pseudocohnilembus persalinus TaxID=266149 RepID=A0A0V0QBR8_PSEPJ|nr:hypothetical protein PPERSA_03754 [Pseudocohnilembus persalinus]|eukprot:KRW99579.1 hypothetical protein PPERSA_03754 [Pseudocohnilembus persalinus]